MFVPYSHFHSSKYFCFVLFILVSSYTHIFHDPLRLYQLVVFYFSATVFQLLYIRCQSPIAPFNTWRFMLFCFFFFCKVFPKKPDRTRSPRNLCLLRYFFWLLMFRLANLKSSCKYLVCFARLQLTTAVLLSLVFVFCCFSFFLFSVLSVK